MAWARERRRDEREAEQLKTGKTHVFPHIQSHKRIEPTFFSSLSSFYPTFIHTPTMSAAESGRETLPDSTQAAVFVTSTEMPKDSVVIKGPDFNQTVTLDSLLSTFITSGFQASAIGRAIEIINEMRLWRLSQEPMPVPTPDTPVEPELLDPAYRQSVKCKIFLGYTSNLVSSGVREVIRFLVQHKLVDCLVSSAGGIEEDFIKCLAPTYLGEFTLDGAKLRKQGLNRIGNLLVPNDNYCKFEDWVVPILDKMLEEQNGPEKVLWAPSSVIQRLGKEIAHEESIYYWAYKVDRNGKKKGGGESVREIESVVAKMKRDMKLTWYFIFFLRTTFLSSAQH